MISETLHYLFNLERFGIRLGLDTMQVLMELLGHPERAFRSIHVAGTNGKGSTCAFLDAVLRKTGRTVGLYTSPHLVRFNERINVNGGEISDRDLIHFTEFIRTKLNEENEKRTEKLEPTFFELTTAIAFLYFASKKVDIAIVEVGMGGRLDATNVVTPLVSVITNVEYDHMNYLGETREKIAREKAGIVKQGVPLVTAERDENIAAIFRKATKDAASDFFVVHKELDCVQTDKNFDFQEFRVSGAIESTFRIRLLGDHQLQNACTAILVLHMLHNYGIDVPLLMVKEGLRDACWPGRLEIISQHPLVIVDGAHNVAGMAALAHHVRNLKNKKVLVLGIAKDKEIEKMVALIVPLFGRIIVTRGNYKPADPDELAKVVHTYTRNVVIKKNITDAVTLALTDAKKDDVVLFTGSLYMIGDALALLRKRF